MKLPHDLHVFPEPALFVAANSQFAKFWLAGGDTLEELDGVALPRERKSDAEGAFMSHAGALVGTPERHGEQERKERFAKRVAEEIARLVTSGHATTIHLSALPEILHRIEADLPKQAAARIRTRTPKDLLNMSDLERIRAMIKDLPIPEAPTS